MRLVTFRLVDDDADRLGIEVEEGVLDVALAAGATECPVPMSMTEVLRGGMHALDELVARRGRTASSWVRGWDEVRLRPPLPHPTRIFALAGNFADHILEGGEAVREESGTTPRVFAKLPTSVIGPEDAIVLPAISETVDYELELAAIIGRGNGSERPSVVGYSVFNDVSARYLNLVERTQRDESDPWYDFINGKWFDTFAPLGPCIVTADEIDLDRGLAMALRINGEVRQNATTRSMMFSVEDAVKFISQLTRLLPGDIVAMGTPAGTALADGRYLRSGDVVEAEIEEIGVLRNVVVDG